MTQWLSDWLVPSAFVALLTAIVAAVKLGWVEIPAARRAGEKSDADAEATRIDTAEQLIGMVRAELTSQSSRLHASEERVRRLEQAWTEHRQWDVDIRAELRRIDPEAYERVGPPPRMTFD